MSPKIEMASRGWLEPLWHRAGKSLLRLMPERMLAPGIYATLPTAGVDYVGAIAAKTDGVYACQKIDGVYTWVRPLPADSDLRFAQQTVAAGDTIANTVTPTAFAATYTIPTASFQVGRVFRVTARGQMKNNSSTPTFTLDLMLGATNVGSISFQHASTNVLRGWVYQAAITVISTGATGSVECDGEFTWNQSNTGGNVVLPINPSAVVVLDTTADRALTLRVTWSAANANNTVTMRSLIVEALGP